MEYDDNGQCWISNSSNDFKGWGYLGKQHWKTDKDNNEIYRVYIRTPDPYTSSTLEMRTVFCKEEHLPNVKNQICV